MLRKIPKAFPRRRSSGNVLDETEPHEGFRVLSQNEVIERKVASESKKTSRLSSVKTFTSPAQKARQQSFDEESGASNRGSNSSGTANSALSRVYDASSPSARFSSSSTLPSSAEQEAGEEHTHRGDPRTFSIRGAARTFTFGNRSRKGTVTNSTKTENFGTEKEDTFRHPGMRERAMTSSSVYGSEPLPTVNTNLELGLSDFGGGFDGLFDSVGKRRSAHLLGDIPPIPPIPNISRSESEPSLPLPPKALSSPHLHTPNPIRTDKSAELGTSPHSLNSPRSNDSLIAPSPISIEGYGKESPPPPPPPHRHIDTFSFKSSSSSTINYQDKDALIVSRSIGSTITNDNQYTISQRSPQPNKTPQQFSAGYRQNTLPVALFDGDNVSHPSDSTPRAQGAQRSLNSNLFDRDSLNDSATHQNTQARPAMKVMNQAQFNSYRKQMESSTADSDSESDDDYDDDEEELERLQEMEKQRRKQEGNLAVYRQQMQKATGEKNKSTEGLSADRPMSQLQINVSDTSFMPNQTAGSGTPEPGTLTHAHTLPVMKFDHQGSEPSSPDEDVPLGVLMAHGFPNKNRPPTKPTAPGRSSSANSVIPGANLSPGQASGAAGSTAGSRHSTLPPFARNLPQDPYYGAGLVNPQSRESLAFGNSGAASAYGGSNGGGSSSMKHTTLVNVIANEERAKAQRRGSPNAQAGFGPAMGIPNQMPQNGMMNANPMNMGQMGMGQMGMGQPGMGQIDMQGMQNPQLDLMAHLLANQQMLQQQMVQGQLMLANMLQGQSGQLPPQFAGMQQPGFPNQASGLNGRPQSIMSSAPQFPQRPQSSPLLQMPGNGVYTPSIAPSERSTIGRASRYRPVTIQVTDGNSTTSGNTLLPAQQPISAPSVADGKASKPAKKGFLDSFKKRSDRNSTRVEEEDEEDEEGWGDAHGRKSKRPESKSAFGLQGLYHGGI